MNPTTESVTAAGILNNHMPIRPHAAMNNVGTGDMHYGQNDPGKDARERKVVERVESFLGPNYNLRKHMMERTQFPERSIMSLEDAFGHYTNSDHNYLTAMIFDNLRGSVNWPITQSLLPLRFLENGSSIRSYTFVRHIFNTALMEEVPTYVAPQIVTRRAESHTMNLGRLALGFNLEHDFMTTEEGARTYEMHLQQLSHALESSIHLRAVRTLVDTAGTRSRINNPVAKMNPNVPNNARKFDSVHELVSHVVNYEVPMFGAVHKRHGLDLVNKTVLPELRREGVEPDSLLVPEHAINIAMFSPETQSYRFTGLTASGTPYTDALDRTVSTVDGMKVYKYRPFRVDSIGDEVVDPLYHLTYSGEWYYIFMTNQQKTAYKNWIRGRADVGNAADPNNPLRPDEVDTDLLAIKVYDEKTDTCRKINYWDALESARKLVGRDIFYGAVAEEFNTYNAPGLIQGDVNGWDELFEQFKAARAPFPCQMLIFRPNIIHRMGSAVMMKSGVETGETLVGYRSLTLSDDGDAGVHKGNFHCWTGSYVKEPKNVLHVPDIIYGGYVGGNSNSLFNYRGVDAPDGAGNILERADDGKANRGTGDNFVIIQKLAKDIEDYDLVLPLSGTYEEFVNAPSPADNDPWGAVQLFPPNADGNLTLPEVMKSNQSDLDCLTTHISNRLVVRGGQQCYNVITKEWDKIMSRAHCGESTGGVRIVREGRMHYGSTDKTNVAIRGHD